MVDKTYFSFTTNSDLASSEKCKYKASIRTSSVRFSSVGRPPIKSFPSSSRDF